MTARPVMGRLFILAVGVAALLGGGGAATAVRAQPASEIEWERIGPGEPARGLALRPSLAGDTLFMTGRVEVSGVYRLAPGDTAWSGDLHTHSGYPNFLLDTSAGTLLAGTEAGPVTIDRSADGGRTWEADVHDEHVWCLYERPSDGAVLACAQDPYDGLYISHDDGRTWQTLGVVTADAPSVARALVEHPTGAGGGAGGAPRLVAGVQNGLAYSDDGGQTWARSSVWGAYRWWGNALALAPEGSAEAGTVYAALRDFADSRAVVFASADGGATWAEWGRIAIGYPVLAVGPDGALHVGVGNEQPGGAAKLYRSADGGRTWAPMIGGYDNAGVLALEVGADGRLYLAGGSGVWRTAEPLPVKEEAGPEPVRARLEVYPNPSARAVTVALTLDEPTALGLGLYDLAGRQVTGIHVGWLGAGVHRFLIGTGALASGLYVVRAVVMPESGAAKTLTQKLTRVE